MGEGIVPAAKAAEVDGWVVLPGAQVLFVGEGGGAQQAGGKGKIGKECGVAYAACVAVQMD